MPTDEQVWQSIATGLIDGALRQWSDRNLLTYVEVSDLLLDLRSAVAPLPQTLSIPE